MTIFDKSVQSVKFVNTITFKTKNDQLMKLYRHFLLLGTAIGLMMPGCTQDEEKLIDTGDELTIQASAREITLKEADAGKEALKLTWTPASDYGLEEDVYYTLEIARADADYSEGLRRDMGKSALSISWTTEGLNDLLTDVLGASSGTMTKYKAMVTATIYGRDDLTQTAETEFSAAAFTPSPYTLFIDGDALGSPAAVMMTRENPGRFSWQGALKEGSVVFRTSDESDWPAYGAGTEEGVLAYYSEDPGTDVSIKIGQIGEYDITADLVDLTYTVRYSEAPVPDLIYIAGEAIGTGSYEDAVMMTRQEKGIFTYNDWVEPGKGFRFITGKLSWWPGYVRDRDSEDGMGVRYFSTDPGESYSLDFSYSGENAGYKLITLNLNDMRVSIEDGEPVPSSLTIGGNALGNPWPWSEDRRMTRTETGYEWTGDMVRGTFRFCPWSASHATWPGWTRDGGADEYWTVSDRISAPAPELGFYVLKAGNYTVRVDFTTNKVELVCNVEHPDLTVYEENLYLVFNTAWDPWEGQPMTNEGDGHFWWEGEITDTENKVDGGVFAIFPARDWQPRYAKIVSNDPDMAGKMGYYINDPVTNFDVEEPGRYRIDVYLDTMDIDIQKL